MVTAAAPAVVQPLRFPVSKPPLTIPGAVPDIVKETFTEWVALVPVPVTVTV